jgi:hypothetical protein
MAAVSASARRLKRGRGSSLQSMPATNQELRVELLRELATATDELAIAVACLTEAYERLSEDAGDQLEHDLFRPVQAAYGRARRAHNEFAQAHSLPRLAPETKSPGMHTEDPGIYVQRAIDASERADHLISELQDSMLPVEVGDTALRAGLSETRTAIAPVPARGRALLRTLGR